MVQADPYDTPPPTDRESPRHHDGVVTVGGLAIVLRLLIERRSVPGVTQDSLIYMRLARHAPFAPYSPTRPSGYALVLRVLDWLPGSQLDVVTAMQHAAGIVVGILVYLLLTRCGVRRWIAVAACAVPLFDAYTVALEQAILAETFFTLAMVAAVYLVLDGRGDRRRVAVSGLLIGLACTIRTVGVLVVPVWLLWLASGRLGRRTVLLAVAGVAMPVLAYCVLHAAQGNTFGLVEGDGWYLYAKVAPIADCRGADIGAETMSLCAGPRGQSFEFYLYQAASPAHQLFSGGREIDLEEAITPRNNRLLRQFSLAVIRAHPVRFARAVTGDFVRYFAPAEKQNELSLYGKPGTPVAFYERTVHTGWLLVAGAFAAGVSAGVFGRRAREASLLVGTATALLLAAAATSGFNIRYMLPALPLLAGAGALGLEDFLAWRWSRARRAPSPTAGGERTVPPDPG